MIHPKRIVYLKTVHQINQWTKAPNPKQITIIITTEVIVMETVTVIATITIIVIIVKVIKVTVMNKII